MKLSGKTAIVTGAAGGIGRAAARLFAAEGAYVYALDAKVEAVAETAELIKAAGGQCTPACGDLTDPAFIDRVIDGVHADGRTIDALYNNAGMHSESALVDLEEAEWDRVIAVNLKSMYLVSKRVVPDMIAKKSGTIVNTSSVCGLRGGGAGLAYTTSKHGVVGLTRALAFELGRYGIRANAICPGAIRTPMTEEWFGDVAAVDIMRRVPLGRVGEAEEIARMALFLSCDDSSFMTGAAVPGDGGGHIVYPTAAI